MLIAAATTSGGYPAWIVFKGESTGGRTRRRFDLVDVLVDARVGHHGDRRSLEPIPASAIAAVTFAFFGKSLADSPAVPPKITVGLSIVKQLELSFRGRSLPCARWFSSRVAD